MQKTSSNSQETPSPGLEGFAEEFLKNRFEEINELKNFLALRDFDSIKTIAHKWKGFSAPYGFGKLEDISTKLEQDAENHLTSACENQLLNATKYLDQKTEELKTTQA